MSTIVAARKIGIKKNIRITVLIAANGIRPAPWPND